MDRDSVVQSEGGVTKVLDSSGAIWEYSTESMDIRTCGRASPFSSTTNNNCGFIILYYDT